SSSSGKLTKVGAGTVTLCAANTYGGLTVVSDGALAVASASALGGTSAGTTVESGASLQLLGSVSFAREPLTLNGTLRNKSGANTWNGVVTLAGPSTVTADAGSSLVLWNSVANGGYLLTVTG